MRGLGESDSRRFIPVLAFAQELFGWGMVGIGVLALYEMRSELSKFYIRCTNETSSLAAL
jgi:hypothetical protein